MSAHLTSHTSVNKYVCDKCDHKTNSQSNLDQHIRGKHGEGWISDCGEQFLWHTRLHRHYNKCKECEQIQSAKESKIQKLQKLFKGK